MWGDQGSVGTRGESPARDDRESRAGERSPGEGPPAGGALVELARLHGLRLIPVQHHHAHLAACLAENGTSGDALGVVWDGTGYGTDGTVWGGEFLLGSAAGFVRAAHLLPFRLPGGEAAVREPRRSALAILYGLLGEEGLEREDLAPVREFAQRERALIAGMLERGIHSPLTTSAGRLFDAVASLIGVRHVSAYEGQAAMMLEFAADPGENAVYPLPACGGAPRGPGDAPRPLVLDWRPLVQAILEDLGRGVDAALIAARFHNALAEAVLAVAKEVGQARVALSGGCFQNRRLTERTSRRLEDSGFEVLLHRQVPPNDGGISLGQVAVAAARLAGE